MLFQCSFNETISYLAHGTNRQYAFQKAKGNIYYSRNCQNLTDKDTRTYAYPSGFDNFCCIYVKIKTKFKIIRFWTRTRYKKVQKVGTKSIFLDFRPGQNLDHFFCNQFILRFYINILYNLDWVYRIMEQISFYFFIYNLNDTQNILTFG